MTPAYLNLSPSPSSASADHQAASSCSYLTTRNFFDLACNQYQSEKYSQDSQQPQFQLNLADNYLASSHGGSFDIENESSDNGLNFSIWKKEEKYQNPETSDYEIKWMSPKMRWMHKMKKDKESPPPSTTNYALIKSEDQKQKQSSPMETENTSNTSSNSMITNPIRTCSDCNTTKTPLWRSGPRGPKSLCNACGIRQRKARRATAAAAAAANDTAFEKETTTPLVIKAKKYNKLKTKTKQQKDKDLGRGVNVAKFKKRSCNLMIDDDHKAQKKVRLEDFLATLTNKLAYDQVFPEDEKDAAILLMAMSLHHAHGQ